MQNKLKRVIKRFNISEGSEDPMMYANLAIQDWIEENEWLQEKIALGDVSVEQYKDAASYSIVYALVLNATQEEHAYYMFVNE